MLRWNDKEMYCQIYVWFPHFKSSFDFQNINKFETSFLFKSRGGGGKVYICCECCGNLHTYVSHRRS